MGRVRLKKGPRALLYPCILTRDDAILQVLEHAPKAETNLPSSSLPVVRPTCCCWLPYFMVNLEDIPQHVVYASRFLKARLLVLFAVTSDSLSNYSHCCVCTLFFFAVVRSPLARTWNAGTCSSEKARQILNVLVPISTSSLNLPGSHLYVLHPHQKLPISWT